MSNAEGLGKAVDELQALIADTDFDCLVGIEARGFLFGMPIAYNMKKAFIPIRKKGKLPRETIDEKYDLEYGSAEISVHKDDLKPGSKVVLIDDLIATGGTLEAACKLVERAGATVEKIICVLELKGLNGREKLAGYDVESLIAYEGN